MKFDLKQEGEFLLRFRAYLDGLETEAVTAEFERDQFDLPPVGRRFLQQLGADGWLGVGWPETYGGQGRSAVEQWLFLEEMAYRRLPSGHVTVRSIGPTLIAVGSEELKRQYLPRILAAELELAMGYSEPDAGTDLAALTTRAVRGDDGYVINGQKVFTTGAHVSSHLWLAARTGPPDSRARGISVLIVPMDAPGVSVRPLMTQADERTNAVFLDDVRVPASCLVGEENEGWAVITVQLSYERLIACSGLRWEFEQLAVWCREHPAVDPAEEAMRRSTLATLAADLEACRLLSFQAACRIDEGKVPLVEAAMAKVAYSELRQRMAQEALTMLGTAGTIRYGEPDTPLGGYFERAWRSSTLMKFGAGTNEVQRSIIAQQGLGLPR